MYSETTRSIRIAVEPFYVAEQSAPDTGRYVFGYRVTIENKGPEPVQLLARHWRITDARGRVIEVLVPEVAGEQPRLEPGASYKYTSGTPLDTPSGIMVGTYKMVTDGGELFEAGSRPSRSTPRDRVGR